MTAPAQLAPGSPLTTPQQDLLACYARRLTHDEIALELGHSLDTVSRTARALYRALRVSDRHAAVRAGVALGLCAPPVPLGPGFPWQDDDPLMQAIAEAIVTHCRSGNTVGRDVVVDEIRRVAAVAASAVIRLAEQGAAA